uniref:Odorant receptor n=1 Tax=Protaetia brevitarsis TaxID=348688 RepID=A0A411HR42_PROBE|nr:odorant receptor [Protaetia brevitarsis]
MKQIPRDDIMQMGLALLKIMGERMHFKSTLLNCFRTFNITMMVVNLFFVLAYYPQIGADYAKYIKSTECALTIIHVIIKYSLFIYHKRNIEDLLDHLLEFWDYNSYGDNIRLTTSTLFRNVKVGQFYYSIVTLACIALVFLKPYVNPDNRFLFVCWTFSGSTELETTVLACQYYFWSILYPIVLGYDSVYFSYSMHIIVQVRLLKQRLQNIPSNVHIEEIVTCINHHKLLISIFARMGIIYFWMLLLHYFITLVTGCSLLYVILLGAADNADLFATIFYLIGLFIQFAYYSFPVEEIVFELTDISRAIYMSNWYEQNVKIKKILLFMMMKSQRQNYLSAGGIIDINVDAFGSVCRKAFSFYALLKTVIDR